MRQIHLILLLVLTAALAFYPPPWGALQAGQDSAPGAASIHDPAAVPAVADATGALAVDSIEVDRIVAVVDEDPIFFSDVERAIALGLVSTADGEDVEGLRRRVLDRLIDQRLQLHVVERYDFGPLPKAEVDRQVDSLRQQFGSSQAFDDQMRALGIDEAVLRQLLRRQLRVLIYVEERLGPKVFVDQEEVRAYYETTLLPALAAQGLDPVRFETVADDIRSLLREQRLNNEIDQWTETLRLEAEIIDLLERTDRPLPPVADRIEE